MIQTAEIRDSDQVGVEKPCRYAQADNDGDAWCGMTYGICDEEAMVMSDRDCLCNGCGLRQVGCHGECDKYKDWQKRHEKQRADVKRRKQVDAEIAEYVKATKHRMARERRR